LPKDFKNSSISFMAKKENSGKGLRNPAPYGCKRGF
jgi:hypothetical protein